MKEERNKLECFIPRQVYKSSLLFHVRPCARACVCGCGRVGMVGCVGVGVCMGVWVYGCVNILLTPKACTIKHFRSVMYSKLTDFV